MPQQKAGGGLLGKVSRHPAPSPTLPDPSIGTSHSSPNGVNRNVAGLHTAHRRWNRKPSFTLSDAAAWTFAVLLTAAGLISLCVLLAIVWPAPS